MSHDDDAAGQHAGSELPSGSGFAARARIPRRTRWPGQEHPADDDALGQARDQATPAEPRRVKRRRAARKLVKKIPADVAVEVLVDIAQNFLP